MTVSEPTDRDVFPVGLRTQDQSGLVATACAAPGLHWRLEARRDAVAIHGFEIDVADDADFASGRVSTGPVAVAGGVRSPWPAAPLQSRQVRHVRVRVRTDRGWTDWSATLRVEGALFEAEDWIARPITPAGNAGLRNGAIGLVRRGFTVRPGLVSARLYVTALGLHETWLNGERLSGDLLEPGWTDYRHRLLYASHDVTERLAPGENDLAAAIGDGWWRGKLTWMERRAVYGDPTAFLAQLELTYADGREIVATDGSWSGRIADWQHADIYDGFDIDTVLAPSDWQGSRAGDAGWGPVVPLPLPTGLEQRAMPAVREVETRAPMRVERDGRRIWIDCGQNLSGYLRLDVRSAGDATITVRHAEVLEPDGALHVAALRTAKATDTYRVGPGRTLLEPKFTYHGFRYAEIDCPDTTEVDAVAICVIASDLHEIGAFSCSDERLNRLALNARWSQLGNFVAIPTDCPQRDERLGWTGDIQVFASTACTLFDANAFLGGWLVDLASEQAADGQVPSTVPNVIGGHPFEFGGVGWGDAATLVPDALFEAYGDPAVLERQYESMRRWVDYGASRRDPAGVWSGDFHLGDWLDPGAPVDRPEEATTPRDLIASSYLARSARAVARAAAVLGRDEDEAAYMSLASDVASATWRVFGDVARRTQAGCAFMIAFDIAPEQELSAIGARLAELVALGDGRIATGFLGTPLVLPALARTGQFGAAYRLLMNEQAPGWLYQVAHGATTMWERWDAILPGGHIHGGDMAAEDAASMISFNHYAYGAVGEWLYRTVAGLAPAAPGYAVIAFAPVPGGGLAWAGAEVETPYGMAASRWRIEGDMLDVTLLVPPGAQGKFHRPAGWTPVDGDAAMPAVVLSGEHRVRLRRAAIG